MPPTDPTSQSFPVVLVADDDSEFVDLFTRFLSRQKIVALSAYNGRECLEKVRQGNIDVIVLDIIMPEMNGLEVCAALQTIEHARLIPVILLTASDDAEVRREGMRLGASEFLVKPTRGADLLLRIQACVEKSRRAQQMERALGDPDKEPGEE